MMPDALPNSRVAYFDSMFLDSTFGGPHLDGVTFIPFLGCILPGIAATLPFAHNFWASVLLGIAGACCHSFCIRWFFRLGIDLGLGQFAQSIVFCQAHFSLSMGLSLPCLYEIDFASLGFLFILWTSVLEFFRVILLLLVI
jgi:hypothetical protein